MNKIKNKNLQHNFFELWDILVKFEQIGQIGANSVKVVQKGKFCKTILDISNSCTYKAIRLIKQVEMATLTN